MIKKSLILPNCRFCFCIQKRQLVIFWSISSLLIKNWSITSCASFDTDYCWQFDWFLRAKNTSFSPWPSVKVLLVCHTTQKPTQILACLGLPKNDVVPHRTGQWFQDILTHDFSTLNSVIMKFSNLRFHRGQKGIFN